LRLAIRRFQQRLLARDSADQAPGGKLSHPEPEETDGFWRKSRPRAANENRGV
jgi:hypothetical protein